MKAKIGDGFLVTKTPIETATAVEIHAIAMTVFLLNYIPSLPISL
jgi:hypothetical protein